MLFNALRGFDQPFNQAPSLHIALAVILWDWYRRLIHARWARIVLHVWAFAICASVLSTWQHHFIDIPTGALLGLVCVWLWPLERVVALPRAWRLARDPQRWKLAGCYAAGAALLLRASRWPAAASALWLAWPAAALALVALNYVGLRRARLPDGRPRPHALVARAGCSRPIASAPPSTPGSGRAACRPRSRSRRACGWAACPALAEWEAAGRPRLVEPVRRAAVAAACTAPAACRCSTSRCRPPRSLRRAAAVIEGCSGTAASAVWVCCALGFSRSAAAVVAWLALHGAAGTVARGRTRQVRLARPQIVLRAGWLAPLDHA